MRTAKIILIAAHTPNLYIGKNGRLPWDKPLKGDLPRFSALTTGHVVIMGRKTMESLKRPGEEEPKPLPNRVNIVLSRDELWHPPIGFKKFSSMAAAIQHYELYAECIFIIGGNKIYQEALDSKIVNEMYITVTDHEYEGDVKFPDYNPEDWDIVSTDRYFEHGYKVIHYKARR